MLARAYETDAVVVTPHPHSHALYANKRNLALLTDATVLRSLAHRAVDLGTPASEHSAHDDRESRQTPKRSGAIASGCSSNPRADSAAAVRTAATN